MLPGRTASGARREHFDSARSQAGQSRHRGTTQPLITRDPLSGGELLVTRLACPESGVVIEGTFSLGWLARLTLEQLEFVRLLAVQRGNVQKVAADLGIAYNTARSRLEDIAAALSAPAESDRRSRQLAVLDRLDAGEIDCEQALRLLRTV